MQTSIPVVDLFAGPGGLGEGFSSLMVSHLGTDRIPFRIALSAEKEPFAHKTLLLRSFYRLLRADGRGLDTYYDYLAGARAEPFDQSTKALWAMAGEEALQMEVGSERGSRLLHAKVREIAEKNRHWVLIGGPPCQAYSVVGRARNKGKDDYTPEKDDRHFLYTHYLELIRRFQPAVFVMENVKGILSSNVAGTQIFTKILEDLHNGSHKRLGAEGAVRYKIYSLAKTGSVYSGPEGKLFDPQDFVLRSEDFGVPQSRHRVILVGIREDLDPVRFEALSAKEPITLQEAIGDLPPLRSGLSRGDSFESWTAAVREQTRRVVAALPSAFEVEERVKLEAVLKPLLNGTLPHDVRGGIRLPAQLGEPSKFARKLVDARLSVVLNHETRGHMPDDFARYIFASAFGKVKKYSPKQRHFPPELAPAHGNWFDGGFADRFRVQLRDEPATTITCHISKDGHYYIHPDPRQCRSLTVREAARLQTFPDNYLFEGNRTEQYIQVGNAVPPLLARRIARKVWGLLKG